MKDNRKYNDDFRAEAVRLTKEVGTKRAAEELGIPYHTLSGWVRKYKQGDIDLGVGSLEPHEAVSLAAEIQQLKKKIKEQEKEIKRIKEENEILEEAAAFFAANRRKSQKS